MANKININDAAQIVMDAETAALTAILAILDETDAKLGEVGESLPSSLSLDATGILNEVRSAFNYQRNTKIPSALARYAVPSAPLDQGMVTYNPNPS